MSEQITFDEHEWKSYREAYENAPHGYKRKAEQRLKDFVHDALRQRHGLVGERKAAA